MTTPFPADFGIKPGGGWVMWLVRLGTFSRYGHAALVVDVEPGADLPIHIVEATPNHGVIDRWCHPSEFRWSTGGPIDLTNEQRGIIERKAWSCLGEGYDYPSIFGFLVRFFGGRAKIIRDRNNTKLFCSELVVWAYREAGVVLVPGVPPDGVSPGDLVDFCPREGGLDKQEKA